MATKAVTRVAADWSKIMSRMSDTDVAKMNRLKAQFDATSVKVASLPESLPAVDWSYYKTHASDSKLVEEIEKKYAAMKVDRPKANPKRLEELDVAKMQDQVRFKKFCEYAQSSIEAATIVKKKFDTMIPVKEMSMEDWTLTFPHWSTTIENPSIYPHLGRTPGLTREEAAAFDQPDPIPYATKSAWDDWEKKYKKFYQ